LYWQNEAAANSPGFSRLKLTHQQTTVDDMIAEGDKVVARTTMRATLQSDLFGNPPPANKITQIRVSIFCLAKARIVEVHSVADKIGHKKPLGGAAL
jgi:predicted ester cyclase